MAPTTGSCNGMINYTSDNRNILLPNEALAILGTINEYLKGCINMEEFNSKKYTPVEVTHNNGITKIKILEKTLNQLYSEGGDSIHDLDITINGSNTVNVEDYYGNLIIEEKRLDELCKGIDKKSKLGHIVNFYLREEEKNHQKITEEIAEGVYDVAIMYVPK